MNIEIIGADIPLADLSRVVRTIERELGLEADWDGERTFVLQKKEVVTDRLLGNHAEKILSACQRPSPGANHG